MPISVPQNRLSAVATYSSLGTCALHHCSLCSALRWQERTSSIRIEHIPVVTSPCKAFGLAGLFRKGPSLGQEIWELAKKEICLPRNVKRGGNEHRAAKLRFSLGLQLQILQATKLSCMHQTDRPSLRFCTHTPKAVRKLHLGSTLPAIRTSRFISDKWENTTNGTAKDVKIISSPTRASESPGLMSDYSRSCSFVENTSILGQILDHNELNFSHGFSVLLSWMVPPSELNIASGMGKWISCAGIICASYHVHALLFRASF